jgi:Fic family protein
MALINKKIHQRVLDKKRKLEGLRSLPSSLVARLKKQMMIEYTYNSNAIEGNTLTLRETQLVIEEGITVGGKSITETLEAKNHPEAIEFIERLVDAKSELTEDVVLQLHRLTMSNITEDAGHYRTMGVRITGATFMPPPSSKVKPRMDELLKWVRENPDELTPMELAAVFHHRFVQIHPFSEGNGRIARLLMNALLMKDGYPFIATVPKLDRPKYLKTLMEADLGNTSSFVNFIARCVERALDMYLDALEEPKILALAEASQITPYSQEYLSLIARKGLLGAYKQGRKWVVSRRELDRYLTSVRKGRAHKNVNVLVRESAKD